MLREWPYTASSQDALGNPSPRTEGARGKSQCPRGMYFPMYRGRYGYIITQMNAMLVCHKQGPTGRYFQLRDGSGSGIGKNFGFGFGYGSGSGIGTVFFINRVLSGIQNLDRVFFGYIPDKIFSFGST